MIVLHAGFYDNGLFLWGEAPSERRKQRLSFGDNLPYNAEWQQITEALAEAGHRKSPRKRDFEEAIAWIPTAQADSPTPHASSGLIAEPLDPKLPTEIFPWPVTGLRLDPAAGVDFLCSCVNKQVLKSGLIIGGDLACWTAALRFAGALVARQQFVPDVVQDGKGYRALEACVSGSRSPAHVQAGRGDASGCPGTVDRARGAAADDRGFRARRIPGRNRGCPRSIFR